MTSATQTARTGPHPYPGLIRTSLERSRRSGRAWLDAWGVAIRDCGRHDPEPVEPDGERFLDWLYRVMRSGYMRLDLSAPDVTMYLEDGPSAHTPAHPVPLVPATHCRWGAGCSKVVKGKRFCPKHTRELAVIAATIEA